MNHYAHAAILKKLPLHCAIAIVAVTTFVLSSCGSSSTATESEPLNMNNPTVTSATLEDPSDEIAGLVFDSDNDDAIYQCLLSAATASATSRGLQAYPVTKIDRPENQFYDVGVYATWCKTVGAGDAVDTDISSCRYLNGSFSAPGTEVLQLLAAPDYGAGIESKVKRIELKSFKIPEQGSTDFRVEFRRIRIGDENVFSLAFLPLDGNTYNRDLVVPIGNRYGYGDPDINFFESYQPSETMAEQKSLLASSASQFKSITTTNYEALKVQVEQALNADSSLDADVKQAALNKAITEIDRRINVIDQNSDAFHRLLLEQFAIEECG